MVFLVSRSRSGSTLLQTILNSHPNICAPIESKFILHLKSKYETVTDWNEKTIHQFTKDLFTNRKIRLFWNVKPATIISTLNGYNISSFADACKAVYLSFPSKKETENINVIVDKNPSYARFVKELHQLFPDAKFIHLIRDPRATIYSQMKAFNKKSICNLAILWVDLNKNISSSIKKLKLNSLKIKYENLVNNPLKEIHVLMNFLNQEYSEGLLESHKTIKPLTKESNFYSLPHHHNTGNPINSKSVDKWKTQLNRNEIKVINNICYHYAIENNYKLQYEKISTWQKIKYTLSKSSVNLLKKLMLLLFSFPFWIRKIIYSIVSFFFDKKYIK